MNGGIFTVLEEPGEVGMHSYAKGQELILKREPSSGIYAEENNKWSMYAEHEIEALKKEGVLEEVL
jgi:hypothetical protein